MRTHLIELLNRIFFQAIQLSKLVDVREVLYFNSSFKFFFREALLFDYIYKKKLYFIYKFWVIRGFLVINFSYINSRITNLVWVLIQSSTFVLPTLLNSQLKTTLFSVFLIILFLISTILLLNTTSLLFL